MTNKRCKTFDPACINLRLQVNQNKTLVLVAKSLYNCHFNLFNLNVVEKNVGIEE